MKKKLLSLLVAATMIGSMAGTTTVFAGEELEDVSEPVTLSLMVLSLIHISEPTRRVPSSRMPSSA